MSAERNGRGGAPAGNRNARKHGLRAAKGALSEFGQRAIDGRSAMGRALADFRADLVSDLGGLAHLSTMQVAVVDTLCRTKLLLDGVDAYIMSEGGLVNKRRKAMHAIVRERTALAESYVRHLQVLGLERRQPPPMSLAAYMAEREHNGAATETTANDAAASQASAGAREPLPEQQPRDGVNGRFLPAEDGEQTEGAS